MSDCAPAGTCLRIRGALACAGTRASVRLRRTPSYGRGSTTSPCTRLSSRVQSASDSVGRPGATARRSELASVGAEERRCRPEGGRKPPSGGFGGRMRSSYDATDRRRTLSKPCDGPPHTSHRSPATDLRRTLIEALRPASTALSSKPCDGPPPPSHRSQSRPELGLGSRF